eukprot:TRINITY_DN8854_c0_g1_i6.p1 TRINITY_DN8854_c0_g1~~TRINITY_DN8854_c0_g1_i6.p1  ORF type:complete len:250 (+),score=96.46 TRINITY_DN8854_c0_g1_i6:82-750(+)
MTVSGKAHSENLLEQMKRHTWCGVEFPFPSLSTRQRILQKVEQTLNPVESALDDVQTRIDKLQQMLVACQAVSGPSSPSASASSSSSAPDSFDVRVLTQFLQGMVLAKVNGGMGQICSAFFSEEKVPEVFSTEALNALRTTLHAFIECVSNALEVHRTLCTSEAEQALQREFDSGFDSLKQEMMDRIKPQNKSIKKNKGHVGFAEGGLPRRASISFDIKSSD